MKIVFTSKGKDWESPVDSVFGRAEGFFSYDGKEDQIEWFSNTKNRDAGHGAGIQAGRFVAELGADVLITGGDVGPKAADVLKKTSIRIFSGAGGMTIREALNMFRNDKLLEL